MDGYNDNTYFTDFKIQEVLGMYDIRYFGFYDYNFFMILFLHKGWPSYTLMITPMWKNFFWDFEVICLFLLKNNVGYSFMCYNLKYYIKLNLHQKSLLCISKL